MAEVIDQDRIEKEVIIAAPVSKVWDALTDYKKFGAWFRVKLDGPFKEGEVTRGRITSPGYENLKWETLVIRMEPEKLFAFSWHPNAIDPDMDYSGEPQILVEFHLTPSDGGTRLLITESGFSKLPDARRLEALRSNSEGWDIQAQNIADYVTA
jgi:uncharacterized protein YndB with AHSA1/START domain